MELAIGQTQLKLEDQEPLNVPTLASSEHGGEGWMDMGRQMEDSQPNKAQEDMWVWGGCGWGAD